MTANIDFKHSLASIAGAAFFILSSLATAQQVPIVQPGAPGTETRELSAAEAIEIADTSYSADDANFMRGMIPHHQQAVEMAALVADRTNNDKIIEISGRIDASQRDEIQFMQAWLTERGEKKADVMAHHHHGGDMPKMDGMATPEQMAALAASNGADFDRMFLELMITHHEGAVTMVDDLLELPGSAYDPTLFDFVSDIKYDQNAEIERMHKLLRGISNDPRADLSPGFRDAGGAIMNLKLLAALPLPEGFYDPANPAGLPISRLDELAKEAAGQPVADQREQTREEAERQVDRVPLLSFANTDMAFEGDVMFAGSCPSSRRAAVSTAVCRVSAKTSATSASAASASSTYPT